MVRTKEPSRTSAEIPDARFNETRSDQHGSESGDDRWENPPCLFKKPADQGHASGVGCGNGHGHESETGAMNTKQPEPNGPIQWHWTKDVALGMISAMLTKNRFRQYPDRRWPQ